MLYVLFTSIHLVANYKAVKSLELETFNEPRLLGCLQNYVNFGKISTVKRVNSKESVFLGFGIQSRLPIVFSK